MSSRELAPQTVVSWDRQTDEGIMPGVRCKTLLGWVRQDVSLMVPEDSPLAQQRGNEIEFRRFAYPEGFEAFVMLDPDSKQPYTQQGMRLGSRHEPIVLANGCVLQDVAVYREGVQSTVARPSNSSPNAANTRGTMFISPRAGYFHVSAEAPVVAHEALQSRVSITDELVHQHAEITIQQGAAHHNTGSVSFYFDREGALKRAAVGGAGVSDITRAVNSDNPIVKGKEMIQMWEAAAEICDLHFARLDLRLSASGLYRAMGSEDFNPLGLLQGPRL